MSVIHDANGERVYKLTGTSSIGQINSGSTKAQAIFDDAVLYPNPYVTIARNGYTKHYYAGTERLATVIGQMTCIFSLQDNEIQSAQCMPFPLKNSLNRLGTCI